MADRVKRVRRRPQLEALKERDQVAADTARRYCPETDCVIELKPWERTHRGLHRCATYDEYEAWEGAPGHLRPSHFDSPWMWGKVGTPFRLGDLHEVRDAALGMVVAAHSRPEDIDEYEAVVRRLQAGMAVR